MAFQVSPGVNISEIDLTTVVPAVATSVGAFAGVFSWGPAEERTLVSSENTLVSTFGKPTADNYETFYTAANFLAYGNALYVVRAIDAAAKNAQAIYTGTEAATILSRWYHCKYKCGILCSLCWYTRQFSKDLCL